MCRYVASLNDPYKQGQYSNVLKTLQDEHELLQQLESALGEIKSGPASTSNRQSQVIIVPKLEQLL